MANLYENSAAPSELWKCSDVTRYLNLIKYEMEHISTSETEKKLMQNMLSMTNTSCAVIFNLLF